MNIFRTEDKYIFFLRIWQRKKKDSADRNMADAPPLPQPRFRQARVLTSNERNRKAEKERAAGWILPPDEEVQWHMARIEEPPPIGELLAFLTVALSHPEVWTTMVCTLPWLWRHSVKDATCWRVWNYFCNRLPLIQKYMGLSRTLRGGWKHGISLKESSHKTMGYPGKDRVTDVNVALHFAGHLANCGPHVPASARIHRTYWLDGATYTTVKLSWSEEFQHTRITKLSYVCNSKNGCNNCKRKGILSDINVVHGSQYGTTSTKKYLFLCQDCKYANFRYPTDQKIFTRRGNAITEILLEVLTEEQMQADDLLRRYEALLYDKDFTLPQRHWVKKKKPPPPTPEVVAERDARRKRKAAKRRREAAKERKRKAEKRERDRKRKATGEAKSTRTSARKRARKE